MKSSELAPTVRKWLRISSTGVDSEIGQTIDACVSDLANAGAVNTNLDDPLVQQAVKLYCKAQFGYDADADKFASAYEHLKSALSLSSDYNTADTTT